DGQKEVINALLDEYEKRYDDAIAESRKKSVDDVKALINDAPYNATQAKANGLIDDALYPEQLEADFKTALGYGPNDRLSIVRSGEYRDISADSLGLNKGERVAVIFASGAITSGRSSGGAFSGNMVGSDTIVEAVNDAANDSSVRAIVLRIDSPGGSALASDLMWNAIENAKAKKPVVVSMSDVAASGGYYIACNANKIVAEPTTITGSIGLFLGKPVVKGLYTWLGVSNEYITRGNNAGIFKETEHWTEAERKKMYDQAHATYFDNFVAKVAKGRKMTPEAVDAIGEGRVWTGTQGKGNGLVDEFGGLEKAIDIAKQLAGLPADKDVRRVVFPAPRPFFETYFNSGDEDSSETKERQTQETLLASLPEDARRVFRYARLLDQMKHGETIMMMPYDLNIK
ncbi:MAG: signal peptide peptidase SppA, partial [Acidobacteriota bacterium]